MKHIQISRFFAFFISLTLLIAPLPLSAIAENLTVAIADLQAELMIQDSEKSYIYLGEELSNIHQVISEISILDDNYDSPLTQLKTHIENGLSLARHNDIADILHYAEQVLQKHYILLEPIKAEKLLSDFNDIIQQFLSGSLSVEINDKQSDEHTKGPFINIITVQGLLSVNDEVVEDITAVSLSATDAIIQNATIATLSTTDQVIHNMSVTNLSVAEETVTAILSANDVVIANSLEFLDSTGDFVGLQAPGTVPTSYTLTLPSSAPTASQVLRANATTPTNLEWATAGIFTAPSASKTIYVTKYGNDSTGNGSFATPYLTLSKAITTANSIATSANPIVIAMSAGIYTENNSSGPLAITANGISIIGESSSGVIIMPNTPANTLLSIGNTVLIAAITFQSSSPSGTGINLTAGSLTAFNNVRIINFLTGVSCSGSATDSYGFDSCLFVNNGTALSVDSCRVETNTCSLFGTSSPSGPAANTGISITGSASSIVLNSGVIGLCSTALNITSNALVTANGINFRINSADVIQNGASHITLAGCTFEITTGSSDIDVQVSGAGTIAEIVSCEFSGANALGATEGTAIFVSNNGEVNISGGVIHNYTTAIQVGTSLDTSSTTLAGSGLIVRDCTTDLLQEGTTTVIFNSSTASSSKMTINDGTNIELAFFDLDDNGALTIGSTADQDTSLIQIDNDPTNHPEFNYKSSLYSTQAIGFENTFGSASSLYSLSANNTDVTSITTDRTKFAGLRLVSDTGSPVGGTSALRGWDINKNGSAAALSFAYQNSDTIGQSAISQYTVMQLDGVNNQLQLPTAATQIVFASDTNLYRSSASVLQTDDNFIVGTLTPGRAVITDPSTNQLASSVTTSTELGFLSGVTSSVQTQLNGKVSKAGDTMTGTLTLPAGTAAAPSLQFTGSTNTGLSAATANVLSFDINGTEQMNLSSSGLAIDAFTTAGVVHNDATGLLSSSLIVNADVSASAGIVDTKLATISTAGKVANSATTATSSNSPSTIVSRDSSGNFSAGTITASLSGNATTATTATNFSGSLSGDVTGTQGATVVSLVGGQTAANVAAATVLANAATNLDTVSTIVKRDGTGSFAAGVISVTDEVISNSATITPFSTAGVVHNDATGLLSSSLIVNADVSASAAIADTKLATISTAGKVANSATTATSANTANAIVARDASGNFSAGTITASLSGNATTATTATNFSGSLSGDVTGTQSATVVSLVGGQTAANVAAATVLANAATNLDTVSTIVKRDGTGSFAAGVISITDTVISNSETITPFTTAGVVHNNSSGLLSSSLIVNADITNATISNAKLATISSSNTPGSIVVRDGSGDFATNMITIAGTTTNPTDVATKAYVDAAASTGLVAKTPALVVSTTDIGSPPAGLQTIDGVTLATNNRVLLVGQTNQVENGLWLAQSGNWTRPADFSSGTAAGAAYVLILSGTVNAGSSWLCNTPTAIIDTDPITFAEFSLPSQTTGANVGSGTGLIFRDKTGNTLNFKSLIQSGHIVITNNTSDITLATDGTNLNTASTLVARDASGNFSAGTITASLSGNATTATTATNFSGSLSGDVTGTQSATVVSLVGGQTAANVAAATVLANAATNLDTVSTIVKRDGTGSFAAGVISVTDEVISNSATITPFTTAGVVHNDATGLLSSSLIVNADVSASAGIVDTKLATISTAGKVANSATTATSANTASAIVARDASGNFSAGTITASLSGNATTATTATNFSGSLSGDVTGTQGATVVSLVGGQTAANVAAATVLANAATNLDTVSTIVKRDGTGSFAAGVISITDTVISNSETITPFTTAGVVHNNSSGLLSSSLIVNADVAAGAAIVDTKLATISTAGKVANSATTATSANTASAIVARDASGNFSAGTITANLTGNVTGNVTGNASGNLLLTGGTLTGTLTLPAGTAAAPSLQFTGSTNTGLSAATANVLSFDINGTEQMNLSSSGLTIDGFTTAGVVHNSAAGLLTSSLIVDADITAATITNDKLANISSSNVANDIVVRDSSGNFSAGTITANLIGSVTGHASLDLPLTGGTLTGTLQLPAGTTSAPSLIFTGSTTTGLSASSGALSFSTSGTEQLKISSGGTISIDAFTAAGVIHNDASGNLSSSLIVNADISASAAIADSKLATISTAGKVANSATTATSANTANAIVARDASGNFSAGTITATLNGSATSATNFTGSLSGDVTGTQSATVVSLVGGQTAANVAAATVLANAATNLNTANAIVLRDGTGSFAAQVISMTDGVHSGNLILSTEPSTSTAGNIIKGSSRFIHDFGTNNTFVGLNAGNFTTSGSGGNSGFGNSALTANTTGAFNTAIGFSTLAANTVGTHNSALGYNALAVSTTGTDNTAIGYNALTANATGTSFNTAVGSSSLAANTTGTNNSALGYNTLAVNTTGANNTAVGSGALAANTVGTANTALGQGSLALNTTGIQNTALGSGTLAANTVGTLNVAVGVNALQGNTTGIHNTAVGAGSLVNNTVGTDNTAVGFNALLHNTVSNNTAVGSNALAANTTGTGNTAVGITALTANTTGNNNTTIGASSLTALTTGIQNTAVGSSALSSCTTGTDNTALGYNALAANATGTSFNTAVGSSSLTANTTGASNTAVGYNTLATNTVGANNTAVGNSALTANTTGGNNTAMGSSALAVNTIGTANTAVGQGALALNTTGIQNTALGSGALAANTIGTLNVAVGVNALENNTTGIHNTAVGGGSLVTNTVGTDNTAVGFDALLHNSTGIDNTAVGSSALAANTIGTVNTAIGQGSLALNTTGSNNTAVGGSSLAANTIGIQNTAVGANALSSNTTGNFNVAVGFDALITNVTGVQNTAVGTGSLINSTVDNNTGVGFNALHNNTTGTTNTAVGEGALLTNTTGNSNTAVGASALGSSTGNDNTALGASALATGSGSSNIAIGFNAGSSLVTGSGNIYIDNVGATESNTIRIGTSETKTFIAGIRGVTTVNNNAIAVLIDSAGQLGTTSSTRRVKHNIEDMDDASANIYQLRPVTFAYNSDASETKQYGLIAEEVDEVFPGIVIKDENGQPETVQYHVLPVLLLNEMQKQYSELLNHKALIAYLQEQLKAVNMRLDALEA